MQQLVFYTILQAFKMLSYFWSKVKKCTKMLLGQARNKNMEFFSENQVNEQIDHPRSLERNEQVHFYRLLTSKNVSPFFVNKFNLY